MRKINLILLPLFLGLWMSSGCRKSGVEQEPFIGIDAINFDNYPKTDGATSSMVLSTLIASKMLGIAYRWVPPGITSEWRLVPDYNAIPDYQEAFFGERIKFSKTYDSFINLVDGHADIILTSSQASPDVLHYADSRAVTLIETPIASDAFVFVVNKDQPVTNLTVEQIQKIYRGEITNWSVLGGRDAAIHVYTRPPNSGSEEVFRELVMKGETPADVPVAMIGGMAGVFTELRNDPNAICYTFNNYKNLQARVPDKEVPKIAINGIFPDKASIKAATYPLVTKLYAIIRSDLDTTSMAYQLYQWLQSPHAQSTLAEAGFTPLQK